MKLRRLILWPLTIVLLTAPFVALAQDPISIEPDNGGVVVKIGGQLFTRYDNSSHDKPILFPIYGPGQIPMTRNYPMASVDGEAQDHPHHKSLWFAHGDVDGVDFWSEKGGQIKLVSIEKIDQKASSLSVRSDWIRKQDQKPICRDVTTFRFGHDENARWIDARIELLGAGRTDQRAGRTDQDAGRTDQDAAKEIKLGDTKEGTFAIRTHPNLRLSPDKKRGVDKVSGRAVNSEGVEGKQIWGKKAAWVDYWGQIENQTVGIAIFDHPDNLRHPTTWHARDYGLIAANPFGLHHFQSKPKGTGDYTIKPKESLVLRYRVVFHRGNPTEAKIEQRYAEFSRTRF